MSTTIDNLQIKIEISSETGAAGIRDLASALGELKKIKKKGSFKSVATNLNNLSTAHKNLSNILSFI